MQCVICGLGGQGALFLSRVLARAGRLAGEAVLVGETHGMSQRGGSVAAFVKAGDFSSALVRRGTADCVLCLEPSQAAAGVGYLAQGAAIVVNAASVEALPEDVRRFAEDRELSVHCVDALALAQAAGTARGFNVALLGYASEVVEALPDRAHLAAAVSELAPPKARELNDQLFESGRAAAAEATTRG
jgi:indolepyruvate ferredoxin oxidoreductase beta subunit